ncbi:nuclear pore complex protein NUP1-like isoform X2 [Primulina tabacum]|uniref:nuclear pore complex protein NUP1-like isoform X2 n=1 Tax=Primulina tabacum TaxID=48773 RepID=UPI003F5ABCD9
MATSGEAEAAAAAATSGAGGKFRKIPFRRVHRPTTPYDRPPASARGINSYDNGRNNSGSLFAKLVVDPAYKLINYGASRFFASVFRKRLPPNPPQPTEVNGDLIDEPHEDQSGAQKSKGGELTQPLNSSSGSGISELEQVLKQKTFSRSEVDHLIELLQSRAVESSFRVESRRTEKVVSDSGRHPIASGPLEKNINEGDISQGVVSAPIINSRVIEDDLASPAELAKAYMGSRPSKASPSMLGTQSLAENGFVMPKSQGRLAIYSMARTPYSRIHPYSIQKGIRFTNICNAGSSMSSYHSLVEQNEKFESKPLVLKRKNSVLDDDLGSVGPIRRIKQKPNLLASKTSVTASGVESGSGSVLVSSKQKLPLNVKPKNTVSKTVGENQDDSNPSASYYTHVPSRSSEVAARILQHLEKLTPKEKSPESKLVKLRDKSPLRLTSSMLGGQAVKIKEDVVSPQLLLNFQDGQKMENTSTAMKNDIVESLKAPGPDSETVHFIVKNGVAQPPLEERAFRMSAQEDDDIDCYEIASGQLAVGKILNDIPFVDNGASVTKEPMLLKANNQPKAIIPSGHISNKTTENGTLGGHMIGLGNCGTVFPPLSAAIQSEVNPHSVDLFGKLKGTKDLPPSSHFSSRTVDKFPPLPSGSSNGVTVLKSENFSGLVTFLPSATGSQLVIPKSDQSDILHPLKAGDANGKSHTVPSTALNGPLVLSSPAVSLTAISACDANQISTASSSLCNPSTSIASFGSNGNGSSTSAAISGNLFGSNVAPSVLGGPVAAFGAFVDPTTTVSAALTANDTVSAALTANDSALVDLKTKAEKEPNFVFSSGKHSAVASFAAGNSGSGTSGFDTSTYYSSARDLQGSPFAGANKFLVSGVENVSQSTSTQSVSSVFVPSSNMNSSISFGSSSFNSQFTQHQIFSFNSSASSSDSIVVASSSEPAKSLFRFTGSSVMSSVSNTTSSFSSDASGIFKFGASSSAPSSVPNTASSFSSGASDVFKFGASSSAPSSASNFLSSNTPSNVFGSTTSTSPFKGFSYGAASATFAPTSSNSSIFNSTTSSSGPIFSFGDASPSMSSTPPNISQPMFGKLPSSSAASPGNGDQMNTDDSMAEDPVQYSAPSIPVFGQPAVSPSPSGFMFGSTAASSVNPFSFGGQQNQVTPQNPSPFQGSGGSFSLGSGGGDKSTRKFIKANRNKNRKK